jgi:phosphonate transport system substrate-binding protein
MMAGGDGSFGYEMEIITHPDSGIDAIEDLRGRRLAFTSPTSNSGYKAPSAILAGEFGMVAERDFEPAFSGKHDNSIIGVANRDYPAATVANSVLRRMIARGVVEPEQIISLYRSKTFPTTGYGYAHDLKPALQAKIEEAFFTYPWAGSALQAEFARSGEAQLIPISYREHWAVIRAIDAANGVSYDCR